MGRPATLLVKILADVAGLQKGMGEASTSVQKAQGSIEGMAVPAGLVLGGVLALGKGASDAASDVEQSFGAVDSVFGDTAQATKDLAAEAARANGLSTAQYAQMSAVLGAQLSGMGTAAEDLTGKTDGLIDIGSDLAATFGGTTADAVAAVSSLLRGERDPIEKYGVSIKEADVAAQKAAMGLSGLTGEADKQATATATLALLTAQTAAAQGSFARETDTAAHAQQVAGAESANAAAAIGEALLPAVILVSSAMSAMAAFATQNKDAVLILGVAIGAIAAIIVALNVALKVYQAVQVATKAATLAWAAVQWVLNAALSANPIGLVVIAIAALVAILVLAWHNSETFRNVVTTVFNAVLSVVQRVIATITSIFGTVAATLSKPFETWLAAVQRVIGAIGGAFRGLASLISGIIGGIQSALGKIGDAINSLPKLPSLPFSLAAPPPAPAVGRTARSASASTGGRGPVTINVFTTGDGMAAEQAIVRALRRQNRINGGVVPAFGWTG